VQKKYKRSRHLSAQSSEALNNGFLCDHDCSISDDNREDISLNTGFFEDKAIQCGSPGSTTELDKAEGPSLVRHTQVDNKAIQCGSSRSTSVIDTDEEPSLISHAQVESTVPTRVESLRNDLSELPEPFVINKHADDLELICINSDKNTGNSYLSMKLCINEYGLTSVYVHGKRVAQDHFLWERVPKIMTTRADVIRLLEVLMELTICPGNFDQQFISLVPVGSAISHPEHGMIAYHEGNFNAQYASTIRSVSCNLLILDNETRPRCKLCVKYRKCLQQKRNRHEKLLNSDVDFTKTTYKHADMPREILLRKLQQQNEHIRSLQNNIDRLERQIRKQINKEGVSLDKCYSAEMIDLMQMCEKDVVKSYPDSNSFQRLFWSQQLKAVSTDKFGIRWHPMIIRWCLAIRQKSQAAYDTVREAGFIKLPSNRTLFDYSHYIKSELGFHQDVLQMLHTEAEKCNSYKEEWHSYCGILFDEVKVKEDLVYNKYSGELIGYCNLDNIGNTIMDLENTLLSRESTVAKYVLVLMVRGIVTSLKFPLAAFATQSISADFLYPILWTAISLLEIHLKLKVLFLTCDGASANRKFFNMHKFPGIETVHYSINPFDSSRKVYFISDVPHLLKTARNCFSNSFSHKNTRRMWRNGKDISWMHVVRLFEDHCEFNMYTPVPKLTRKHVDLNAFSYMKVSLAAQIFSDSVAYALEDLYGEEITETVSFIKIMNKFFDILNVRSLVEGRNKRNSNLNPFTSTSDERLSWLVGDFKNYFRDWERSVDQRQGNFTKKEKASMGLSHQTLTGLEITVNSICECTKFMLNKGAKFILTSVFNQDPLEQHFGHYRHKGGHNRNPTVDEVRHILTSIRTVGAQALAPRHGNT
jgi:hypothetical protein